VQTRVPQERAKSGLVSVHLRRCACNEIGVRDTMHTKAD
jgi:hypothetical protein